MKEFLRDWLGVSDLEHEVSTHDQRLDNHRNDISKLYDGTRAKSSGENQMNYSLAAMTCTLNMDLPYEVLCVTSKKLICHPGHKTLAEAKDYAEALAAAHPGREFVVYGPMLVSRADIPVVSTSWPSDEGTDK